jgi:hypothetical protein
MDSTLPTAYALRGKERNHRKEIIEKRKEIIVQIIQ